MLRTYVQTDNQIYDEGGQALARALQTNRVLRNFRYRPPMKHNRHLINDFRECSYGGQGATANRIDVLLRRVIDQAVLQNKRYWELFVKGNGSLPPPGAGAAAAVALSLAASGITEETVLTQPPPAAAAAAAGAGGATAPQLSVAAPAFTLPTVSGIESETLTASDEAFGVSGGGMDARGGFRCRLPRRGCVLLLCCRLCW